MPTIASLDTSRPIWPSCPAPGWLSGVDRLTCRPNGKPLVTGSGAGVRPSVPPFPQESHGPYTAFLRTVSDSVMPSLPEIAVATGPGSPGWFRSEFGCTSWSSFELMSGELPAGQWSMDSPAAKWRDWNASNVIGAFFGEHAVVGMEEVGAAGFQRQLYQSMIAQVLFLKAEIETWRAQNIWGSLIWMCKIVILSRFACCPPR